MAFQMGFISHFGLKRVLAARRLERRGWTGRGWARTDCGPLGALQGWGLLTPIRRFWVTRGRALCWTCGLDVWAGRGSWTRGLDAGAGRWGLVAGSWPRPSGCHPLQRRSGSALLGLCPFSEQPLAWSSPASVPSLPPADWDECADGLDHDCSPAAQCINLEGSYTCRCLTARDANPARAGRACAGVSPTRHPSGSGPCSRRGLGGGGGVAFCVLYVGHSVAGPPIQ